MRRKWVKIIAILILILSGSYFVYNKLTKPNLGPKTTRLYKRGFDFLKSKLEPISKTTILGSKRLSSPQSTLLKKGQHSQMPMCVLRSMTSMEIKLLWEIK